MKMFFFEIMKIFSDVIKYDDKINLISCTATNMAFGTCISQYLTNVRDFGFGLCRN